MENSTDYYQVLGVNNNDPKSAIADAFRRQVKQWHPAQYDDEETHQTALQTFCDLYAGFMLLMHSRLRQTYDAMLQAEAITALAEDPKDKVAAQQQYTAQFRAAIARVRKTEERGRSEATKQAEDYEAFSQQLDPFINALMSTPAAAVRQGPQRKERSWAMNAAEAGCLGWLLVLLAGFTPSIVGIFLLRAGIKSVRSEMAKKGMDAGMLVAGMILWALVIAGFIAVGFNIST